MKKKVLTAFLILNLFIGHAQGVLQIDSCSIFYATDVYELSVGQKKALAGLVNKHFRENESGYFHIQSFTDEKGTPEYNKELSQKRAKAIADELLRLRTGWKEALSTGMGIDLTQQDDSLQRHSIVRLYNMFVCGTNMDGAGQDTLDLYNPRWFKNIRECFSSEQMIKDEMYAVDVNENILKTGGMISFELTNEALNTQNFGERIVSVCIPLKKGEAFDPEMKLWSSVTNKEGETRWESMVGEIFYDKKNSCYKCCFRCGSSVKQRYFLNIDKKMNVENVVYFSTFKDYGFTDVFLDGASFSAILNVGGKKVFAFVTDGTVNPDAVYFRGVFSRNGKTKRLRVKLEKCDWSKFRNSDYFLLEGKSNYFIDKKEYNKKGFIAWVSRLFDKGDRY